MSYLARLAWAARCTHAMNEVIWRRRTVGQLEGKVCQKGYLATPNFFFWGGGGGCRWKITCQCTCQRNFFFALKLASNVKFLASMHKTSQSTILHNYIHNLHKKINPCNIDLKTHLSRPNDETSFHHIATIITCVFKGYSSLFRRSVIPKVC